MSFASDIKDELLNTENMPECCLHAMAYGMFLFGRSFSYGDISLMTDNGRIAEKYNELAMKVCKVNADTSVSDKGKFTVGFDRAETREKVLNCFSCTGKEPTLRIGRGNLLNECFDEERKFSCCDAAFLRGAFLSCGTASDPSKSYHLEFVVPFKTLSLDLLKLLNDYGIKAKHTVRRYVNVIYIKDSESIEDLLVSIGAPFSFFEILNTKIYKDLRNHTNRKLNFENANFSKTLNASFLQLDAIAKLRKSKMLETLSDDFIQVAKYREKNRDASLKAIGEMCTPVLSRSAVNHRLKKIIELASKLEAADNTD